MKGERKQEFASVYEAFYWRKNLRPSTPEELNREFGTRFTPAEWDEALENESLLTYLRDRGVPLPNESKPKFVPKQLDFITLALNPADRRSLGQKLHQLRISQGEFASWMRDSNFASLLREESSKLFSDSRFQVLSALAAKAAQGDVSAMKFYFEMTGEYAPGTKNSVNVTINQDLREMTQRLLEVLQRYVPPQTLELVAGEFEAILFPSLPRESKHPVVQVRELSESSLA